MKVIEFKNVTFKYGENDLPVIKNLSFSVNEGEYLCILGKNGSGKSTIAKLTNGLLLPTEGDIEVFGYNTKEKSTQFEVRKRVGLVFQNPDNQMIATIVEDDIAFGPENLGVEPSEIGKRIDFALESTQMQKYRNVSAQKLSGGQKQRIAIAGVLAVMPNVIILDESTSMLDGKGRKEVLEVVKKLNEQGMTVITITHYMDEAVNASRVIVVSDGNIVKDGTPSQVFKNSEELLKYGLELPRATYIANSLIKKGLPLRNGILTANELTEELCKLFQRG